jgi:hypothetical protein
VPKNIVVRVVFPSAYLCVIVAAVGGEKVNNTDDVAVVDGVAPEADSVAVVVSASCEVDPELDDAIGVAEVEPGGLERAIDVEMVVGIGVPLAAAREDDDKDPVLDDTADTAEGAPSEPERAIEVEIVVCVAVSPVAARGEDGTLVDCAAMYEEMAAAASGP